MNKIISFLIAIIIGVAIFSFFRNTKNDIDVNYKSTSQFGVEYEIPDTYTDGYLSTGKEYYYTNKSNTFKISVATSEPTDITLEQYIIICQQMFTTGSAKINGGTATRTNEYITNRIITENSVVTINGINMGKMIVNYDYKQKEKIYKNTEYQYCIKVNNEILVFDFTFHTKDIGKFQEIIDKVVNSIKIP